MLNSMNYNSELLNEYKSMSEPMPDDAKLYQPLEAEQILIAENASCLAVRTYLKMCSLPCEIICCHNAEFMSPGGRMTKLPILTADSYIFAEFEPIANFLECKGISPPLGSIEIDIPEMRTYVSLTENILTMAELYFSFMLDSVYKQVTSKRIGCAYPWPLNRIHNYNKYCQAKRILKVYQWDGLNIDDVINLVSKCCDTLELKFNETEGPYFYGDQPCELDAIVFGHLFTILTTNLPNKALATTVSKFNSLHKFCAHIEKTYFT